MGNRAREAVVSESIEGKSLDEFVNRVKKPIDDLQIYIDSNTIKHFSTLSFNVELRDPLYPLFTKIENYFHPNYNKFGWAWPEIYTDKKKRTLASFKVALNRGGYLAIKLNRKVVRKVGMKDIVQEIYKVFNFLDTKEFEQLLFLFDLEKTKSKAFVHLANKLGPKEKIDEKLKGAILRLNFVDFYGEDIVYVKVDYSQGPEIEIEGEESTSLNLNTIIVEPSKAVRTLRGIAHNVEEIMDALYLYLMKGLNENYKLIFRNGQLIETLQETIKKNHQETLAYISEVDMNNQNLHLQEEIILTGINEQTKNNNTILQLIQKDVNTLNSDSVPELKTGMLEIQHIYNESNQLQLKNTESLIDLSNNVVDLINKQVDVKDEIQEKIERSHLSTDKLIIDTTNQVIDNVKTLGKNIEKKFDEFEKSFKNILKEEFRSFGAKFRNNLHSIIRHLYLLPGLTSKELSKKLNRSRSSIYNYLKRLQDRNLIKNYYVKRDGPGRPSKKFNLSEKAKNLIKKLKS